MIPNLPSDRHAVLVATATLGTTLAPWGLAFIQSYTADKQLKPKDWSLSRIDIATGAVLTGVIGLFVVVATTETLYRNHRHINDARDAAVALAPLAGHLASTLFAIGLVGAGMLAAAILPLSTAYSVAESFGHAGKLDGKLRTEPIFYGTFVGVTVAAAGLVHDSRRATRANPVPDAGLERGDAAAAPRDDHPSLPRQRHDGLAHDRACDDCPLVGDLRTDRCRRRRARRVQPLTVYQMRYDSRERKTPCPAAFRHVTPLRCEVHVNAARCHDFPYGSVT